MSDTLSEIFSMAYEEFKTTVTDNGVEVTGRIPLPRDLVLVTRCKDCVYWDATEKVCVDMMTADENGYCSWGERKDDTK